MIPLRYIEWYNCSDFCLIALANESQDITKIAYSNLRNINTIPRTH
jgi:hypothetical protein